MGNMVVTNRAPPYLIHLNLVAVTFSSPEQYFHLISAFVVLPLFALANAGVALSGDKLGMVTSPIAWGVVLGLVIGKQVGITVSSWVVIRMGWCELPEGVNW